MRYFALTIVLAFASSPALSAAAGDRVLISVPVTNWGANNGALRTLTISVSATPPWVDVLPISDFGPVTLAPGTSHAFQLEFEFLPGVQTSDGTGEISYILTSADGKTAQCNLSTRDFFAHSAHFCADARNNPLSLQKAPDYIPPATEISFRVAPYVLPNGTTYMAQIGSISLSATDIALSTVARSGIDAILYAIDSSTYVIYGGPFRLTEGQHLLNYYSRDKAGNNETAITLGLSVDGTPPQSTLSISGYASTASANNVSLPSGTAMTFLARDPPSAGVASGVSRTLVQIDTRTIVVSSGPIAPPDGFHQITYFSIDNTENVENPNVFSCPQEILVRCLWPGPVRS